MLRREGYWAVRAGRVFALCCVTGAVVLAQIFAAPVGEDDAQRYIVEKDVAVPIPDGGLICTLIVRPREAAAPLPTLLQFTIYNDAASLMREALRSASHGYVAIMALTR